MDLDILNLFLVWTQVKKYLGMRISTFKDI